MRKSLPLAILLLTAGFVPAACGSKSPAVPAVSLDAGFAFNAQDAAAGPVADSGAPVAPVASTAASVPPPGSASAAPTGSAANLLAGGLDVVIDAALAGQATKDAPGMAVEGETGRATLSENGHFNMVVTLMPGRCYTVIAMSAPLQVTELGVTLVALPLAVEAGRSPATDKNPAVLGRGKGAICPIVPLAVPYKLDVVAKKGAGRIGVRVLSRAK